MGKRENKKIDYRSDFLNSIKNVAYSTVKSWAGKRTQRVITYVLDYGEGKAKELGRLLTRKELKCQESPDSIETQRKSKKQKGRA